ncbi:hypothetical protein [Chitinophaga sp. YIM B06452]|uniref:hypothetical protein n=1 Tax=Chitinophaga sp. YIM B06452 TaxID=3082158 RepID=UPI0031FEDF33
MKFLYLISALALLACNNAGRQAIKNSAAATTADSTVLLSKRPAGKILELYENLSFDTDTLNLGSVERGEGGGIIGKYKGRWLDSAHSSLLPVRLTQGFHPAAEDHFMGYYACYKFRINERLTGLLTRTPGEYDISVLSLLYYDHEADSIGYAFDLVHDWGDAGDAVSYNTWLIRNSISVDAWMAVNSIWGEVEDSAYNSSTNYYRTDLATRALDTSNKNKPEWAATFKYLIGEKEYEVPDSVYVNKHSYSQ